MSKKRKVNITEEPHLELSEDSEETAEPEKSKTVNDAINDTYGIEKLEREFMFQEDVKVADAEGNTYSIKDLKEMSDRRFKEVRNSLHQTIGNTLKTIGENKELTDKLLPSVNMTISTVELISLERRIAKLEKNRSSKPRKKGNK